MVGMRASAKPSNGTCKYELIYLNSVAWEEEIQEVLDSVNQEATDRYADPDWQAASRLLVAHCREALQVRSLRLRR